MSSETRWFLECRKPHFRHHSGFIDSSHFLCNTRAAMTSTDPSPIEAITYLGCGPNRLSRLELLQHQQHQQFHMAASPATNACEHECNCMHHHPLANHHHHHANASSNGAYGHHHNHFNHNHLNQHMHGFGGQDGIMIYNNSSTNSECNQPASNNDGSQSGCSNIIHYVPTSNLSVASQSLNIPNCECRGHHAPQHHHQRQSSRSSSRIVSCDENPSGTEDGSGLSTSGMITACRASKRNLWVSASINAREFQINFRLFPPPRRADIKETI